MIHIPMSAPVSQRTHLLGALRGFALFGVVWSNYAAMALRPRADVPCAFLKQHPPLELG